jgi:hypothetical protein
MIKKDCFSSGLRFVLMGLLLCLASVNIAIGQFNSETEYWQKQFAKAREERDQPTGVDIEGLLIPPELSPDKIDKQEAKLAQLKKQGFKAPLDYSDLALKKLDGELIAIAFVTSAYLSDVGGSVTIEEFTQYNPLTQKSIPLKFDSPKFTALAKLASDFDGIKYDLTSAGGRKGFKINLLRLVDPKTKDVLEKLATAYKNKFDRPLRVTSAVRTVEYQYYLSRTNANAAKTDSKILPSHISGYAFDLAYKYMTAEEQNFLMAKLAEMEKEGILDALRESGGALVFHVFVYPRAD